MVRKGERVGGYPLHKKLAGGGFATVWLTTAKHGLPAAIKILHSDLVEHRPDRGPSIIDRFLTEVRILERLEHPGLVQIYDLIEGDERGNYAYVMELLTGFELRTIVPHLQLVAVLEVFAAVAGALSYVHANDVIHRDVTVRNIIVCNRDEADPLVKLIDFGIAKDQGGDTLPPSTMTGHFTGVLGTMAPECFDRIQQRTDDPLTGAVDQWSLGVALYQCLSGKLPFAAAGPAVLIENIRERDPPPITPLLHYGMGAVPPAVDAVLRRCLAKKPQDRYPDAAGLQSALQGVADMLRGPGRTDELEEMLTQAQLHAGDRAERTLVVPVAALVGPGAARPPSIASTAPDAKQQTDPEPTVRIDVDHDETLVQPEVWPVDEPTPVAEAAHDPTQRSAADSEPVRSWDELMGGTDQVPLPQGQATELAVPVVEDRTEIHLVEPPKRTKTKRRQIILEPVIRPAITSDDEELVRPVPSGAFAAQRGPPSQPPADPPSPPPARSLEARSFTVAKAIPAVGNMSWLTLLAIVAVAVLVSFFLGWSFSG